MKSLFKKSLEKLTHQIGLKETRTQELFQIERAVQGKTSKPIKLSDLVMLPNSDIKTMLKVPCPIYKPIEEDVELFKNLRRTYEIDEKSVCSKCPLANKCKGAFALPKVKVKSPVEYIVYFLFKLQNQNENELSQLRWSAAFRLSESLRIALREIEDRRTEILLYHEALKEFNEDESIQSNRKERYSETYEKRRFHLDGKEE